MAGKGGIPNVDVEGAVAPVEGGGNSEDSSGHSSSGSSAGEEGDDGKHGEGEEDGDVEADESGDGGSRSEADAEEDDVSERGADDDGEDEEVYDYTWIEGVSKDVDFAAVESNDNCQQCSKRIQSRSFDSSRAIKCNMCYFAFHNKCLVPPISEQQCRTPSFFACCSECIAECERKQ